MSPTRCLKAKVNNNFDGASASSVSWGDYGLQKQFFGGSPGLVVMGDDSCSRVRMFESRRHILDGHDFFTWICCKKCIVCLKWTKINKKRPGLAHLKKQFFRSTIIKKERYNFWSQSFYDLDLRHCLISLVINLLQPFSSFRIIIY